MKKKKTIENLILNIIIEIMNCFLEKKKEKEKEKKKVCHMEIYIYQ